MTTVCKWPSAASKAEDLKTPQHSDRAQKPILILDMNDCATSGCNDYWHNSNTPAPFFAFSFDSAIAIVTMTEVDIDTATAATATDSCPRTHGAKSLLSSLRMQAE